MHEGMNLRERLSATFHFEPCPRTPRWEMGYWAGAVRRWYDEGLPGTQQAIRAEESFAGWVRGGGQAGELEMGQPDFPRDRDIRAHFGMDQDAVAVEINSWASPEFETVALEETNEHIIHRDKFGVICKTLKPEQGMPLWIDYPVHNRQEWERFKAERYQPDLAGRVPPDWEERLAIYRQRDFPLCLGRSLTGFFGTARQILGLDLTLITFYDDPAWMHEIMDYLADFYVALYDQVLSLVKVDYAHHWEDMCFKNGPLISPQMFAEFMVQPYKRLTGLLRDHGVDIVIVDTDGDARKLIPLFLEGGVTALLPFEAQSHMDVAHIRGQYPRLGMQGGIDKKALAAGKAAIDRELEARVPVVLSGGYIPHVDHGVPPDVSWENFSYYRRKLDAMLDEFDAQRWEASRCNPPRQAAA